ncbi:MAG: HD domain-containing protein [Heliobacteriaceae bacterium]|nr:HD domain-containing protein [Heliobacteriaceae bacterium]
MVQISLKRLVAKKEVISLIREITGIEIPVWVWDAKGILLFGDAGSWSGDLAGDQLPVKGYGKLIGWVGGPQARVVATLLSYLASVEFEKKVLGRETLEKYRELTLFYDFCEKLAANLDPKQVAQVVIAETQKLIRAQNIAVVLFNGDMIAWEVLAAAGPVGNKPPDPAAYFCKAEIVNDVFTDARYRHLSNAVRSLMFAPLRIKDKVIGVIIITSDEPKNYTAEDLKVLTTLAFHAAAAIENARLYDSLKEGFLTTVYTLAETIEKRDPYTGGHTKRVMNYCAGIGKALGLAAEEMEKLKLAAVLHDIGKIGVSDEILLKKDRLTAEEFEAIKKHTIYGEEILNHIKQLYGIIPGVKHHHERYDGSGYPENLEGDNIDITARIIAVADAFDAMTTDRPYRKGMSPANAIKELEKHVGSQFDPVVVKAFVRVFKAGLLNGKAMTTEKGGLNWCLSGVHDKKH